MERIIRENFKEMAEALNAFAYQEANVEKIKAAALMMSESIRNGGKVIACGNGGSLCDAAHFAEELTARFRDNRKALPAEAITDPAFITCVANDFSFEEVFSRYLEALGKPGDTLLAMSTSGNSPNVVKAAITAHETGIKVVALTGKAGNKLSALCDVEICTPPSSYSDRSQEIHIKVIHTLVQLIEMKLIYSPEYL